MEFFIHDTYFIVSPTAVIIAATLPITLIAAPILWLHFRRQRQRRDD